MKGLHGAGMPTLAPAPHPDTQRITRSAARPWLGDVVFERACGHRGTFSELDRAMGRTVPARCEVCEFARTGSRLDV